MKKVLLYITVFVLVNTLQAQTIPSEYFLPQKIAAKPRATSSFFNLSYGLSGYNHFFQDSDNSDHYFSKDYVVTWYKTKKDANGKGFEMQFAYNKAYLNKEFDYHYIYQSLDSVYPSTQTYQYKLSKVFAYGAAGLSFIGSYSNLMQNKYISNDVKLWGVGAEFFVGGHPYYHLAKKNKWPVTWSYGAVYQFMQQPEDMSDEVWENNRTYLDEYTNLKAFTDLSLQRFAYKRGLRLYLKAYAHFGYCWIVESTSYSDNFFEFNTGAAIGIML